MVIHDDSELPPGVIPYGEGYEKFYYRDGRMLMSRADEELDEVRRLRNEGRMTRLEPGDPAEDGQFSEDELARLEAIDCLIYTVETDDENSVPGICDQIRRSVAEAEVVPRMNPNYVWFGASHMVYAGEEASVVDRGWSLPPDSDVGRDVRIVVFDTGVHEHDVFPSQVDASANDDPIGHGTFVTGVILRYAPAATIVNRQVLSPSNHVDDVRLALHLLDVADDDASEPVDIINLSMSSPTHLNLGAWVVEFALEKVRAAHPGVAIVAAAGNWHSDRPNFPAALAGVVAAAAVEAGGVAADFTSFGGWVDAHALGRTVGPYPLVPQPTEGWAEWAGTSVAAPVVAGAIAAHKSTSPTPLTASEAAHQLILAGVRLPGLGAAIAPEDHARPH